MLCFCLFVFKLGLLYLRLYMEIVPALLENNSYSLVNVVVKWELETGWNCTKIYVSEKLNKA